MGVVPVLHPDEQFIARALELASEAEHRGEVPVGALLVNEGAVVAEASNRSIEDHDPTAHAEIQVLRAAGQALGNYRLPESTLYVTLEPCPMCAGAMIQARIRRLAAIYLRSTRARPRQLRFDVAAVLAGELTMIPSAF